LKNVKYTNLREVTADDFKYTFRRILSPTGKSPNTWVLEKISGAKEFMGKDDRYLRCSYLIDIP
jgi:ABC-type transport system substrate-binding protein